MAVQQIGLAEGFSWSPRPILGGNYGCEASLFRTNGDPWIAYAAMDADYQFYTVASPAADLFASPSVKIRLAPGVTRFPYIFDNGAGTWQMCAQKEMHQGDLYLWYAVNPAGQFSLNQPDPILRQQATGPWSWIANCAILPVGTKWHLFAEIAGGIGVATLDLSKPLPGGVMDFTPYRSGIVLPYAGNPEVKLHADGRTIIMHHGVFCDHKFGGTPQARRWYSTISTADACSDLACPESWTTHSQTFAIGEWGQDICDPATFEAADGSAVLLVSYLQKEMRMLQRKEPWGAIYDRLLGR